MRLKLLWALLLGFVAFTLPAQVREYNEATKKRGISDYEGTPIVPAIYDAVTVYYIGSDTFYVAQSANKKGVFDQKGQLTIPFDYEEVELWAEQSDFQFGYAVVAKDRRMGRGVLDARNGQTILPIKFEFIRAVSADLLVGRQFVDSTLQFFNERGQPLFQLFGRSASPGFDENSIKIKRVDRSEYFVDKKGRPIFPPNLKQPQWTDGERVICIENGKFGLVTMTGKTLIPFEWQEMKVQNAGQFWVKNQSGEQGLMDASGQFIIPLSKASLYLPGGKSGPIYIRSGLGSDPAFDSQLFDTKGQLLFSDVRVSSANMASQLFNVPFNRREDYFSVEMKDKKQQLLFHKTRGQILPTAWSTIWYGGEKHVLIAVQEDENGLPTAYKAFDLNGTLRYEAPKGMSLEHTPTPDLLFAFIDTRSRIALLDLNHPEKLSFEYSIFVMYNRYFVFEQNAKKGILDPQGKVLVPANKFIQLGEPNKIQVQQFRATKAVRGKLIAVGQFEGVQYPSWVAVNSQGETFVMGPPAPLEPVKAAEPRVEEAAPLPFEAVEEAGVMEEMGQNPTSSEEVVAFVEKQPTFPGGDQALYNYLAKNLQYPKLARKNGIQGKVVVSFVVEKDGSLSDLRILRDCGGDCGKEAMRLIRAMPKWIPGMQNGQVVQVRYTLPVTFRFE